MSVWGEMGFRPDGKPFGVTPRTFIATAYEFWSELRELTLLDHKLPPYDFDWIKRAETPWYAYRMPEFDGLGWPGFARPVPAEYWNGTPDWPSTFAITEDQLLGEQAVTPVYPYFLDTAKWAEQRYRIIKFTRYAVIPLAIHRVLIQTERDERYLYGGIGWGGTGRGATRSLSVTFLDYWKQATVRKIGLQGESGKPVSGVYWTADDWDYEYPDYNRVSQQLNIYGAVDLATHPDFAQYFDT